MGLAIALTTVLFGALVWRVKHLPQILMSEDLGLVLEHGVEIYRGCQAKRRGWAWNGRSNRRKNR